MRQISWIIIWTCFMIFNINATDTYLNFTTGINLENNVKEVFSQQIGSVKNIFIFYTNRTICRYDSKFQYLSQMNSTILGDRNLSNLKIVYGHDGYYLNGIVQGGSQSIMIEINDVNIRYSILAANLKHVTLLYADGADGIILMEYMDDIAYFGNYFRRDKNFNFSINRNTKNYVVKVITVDLSSNNKCDVVFTSLKQVYLIQYSCHNHSAQAYCWITHMNLINSLVTVSTLEIKGYFIDVNFIITIQFSDGKLYSFYYNGTDIPIDLSTIQAHTGSSSLKQILCQNSFKSRQRVFVYADKSIRAFFSYFTDSNGKIINGSYTYQSDSQESFPISNWTGLVEHGLSNGIVYTKGSPIIFSYCFTKETGMNLTGCQTTISCPIFACHICNSARTLCLTCLPGYNYFAGLCQNQPTESEFLNETNNHSETSQNNSQYLNFVNQSSTVILITKNRQSFTPSVQNLLTSSHFVNSFPGSRLIFGFLTPMFGFFDDYWYYIYHEDNYIQLYYTPLFLVFMYTTNQQRILPEYMNFGIPFNISSFIRSNYTKYTHGQIYSIQNNQTYFIENTQQMIFKQYILILFGVLFVKLIIFFLQFCIPKQVQSSSDEYKLKHSRKFTHFSNGLNEANHEIKTQKLSKNTKKSVLSGFKIWLSNFISLKSVLLMLFSSNLMFIFFTFSSQIRIIFSFNSLDKGNQALTILIGFIMIAFTVSIALYQELFFRKRKIKENSNRIWDWQDNRKSKIIYLNRAKRQNLFLTYFTHIKTIFYGFVHGFFIIYPNIQYALLVLIKIYLIYIIITRKKMVRSLTLAFCIFLYYVGGIFIDLLCYLSKNEMIPDQLTQNVLFDYSLIKMFEILCLMTVCLSVLCQILVESYLGIKEAFFLDNKIANQLQKHNSRSLFKLLRKVLPQSRNQKSRNNVEIKNSTSKSGKVVSFKHSFAKRTGTVNYPNNSDHQKDFIVQKQSKKQLRGFHNLNYNNNSKIRYQKANNLQLREFQSCLAKRFILSQNKKIKSNLESLKQNRIKEKSLTTNLREKVKPINTMKIQFLKEQKVDANQIDEIQKTSRQQFQKKNISKLYLNFGRRFKTVRQHKLKNETIQNFSIQTLEKFQ